MTNSTSTTTRSQNEFFEVRLNIFAGSNKRITFSKDAMGSLGFKAVDFDSVKAMLQTDVLPQEAFLPFLAIRKSVQEYLATRGINHDLMGRIFNPNERIEIVTFLKSEQVKYAEAKVEFLLNYASYTSGQLEKVRASAIIKNLDPDPLVDAVRLKQPSASYYDRKLEFRFLDLSIELNSEEWNEEIDKINSDIEARTIYEVKRDSESIRDISNARVKANALLSLASRLKSLDFYVPGLKALAVKIETIVSNVGGLKAGKSYEAQEVLMLTGLAKQLSQNAHSLIAKNVSLDLYMSAEASRIEAMFADEEQVTPNVAVIDSTPASETVNEKVNPVSRVKPVSPAVGAFNF